MSGRKRENALLDRMVEEALGQEPGGPGMSRNGHPRDWACLMDSLRCMSRVEPSPEARAEALRSLRDQAAGLRGKRGCSGGP
jgi:hypothetical protein